MMRTRELSILRDALILLLLALMAASVAAAQERRVMTLQEAPPEIRMPEGQDAVRVPFTRELDHVVLSLSVNGSEPMRMVLDTGMPMGGVMMYGTPEVEALGLDYGDMRVQVGGAGGDGQHLEARMATDVSLRLGDLELGGLRAIVMPPLPHFASRHDGVIGAALFRNFAVRIDEDAGVIELTRPGAWTPSPGAAAVPLTFQGGVPYAEAEVVMVPGQAPVPVRLVVDLGAGHNVSLNATSSDGIAVPPGAVATRIGRGISGVLTGHVGRIAEFRLGGTALKSVVATFPDSAHENPRGMDSRNGNLGSGILGRFNVTFDYVGERMLLEPSKRLAEPFLWNMAGLVLEVDDDGGLVIADVVSGSPAAEAGLQADDRLLAVSGEQVAGSDLVALTSRFRRDEGADIEVRVERGGETREARFTLRSFI